jgi:hypothetical protein
LDRRHYKHHSEHKRLQRCRSEHDQRCPNKRLLGILKRILERRLRLLSRTWRKTHVSGPIRRPGGLAAGCICAIAIGSCASNSVSATSQRQPQRAAIERYLSELEPIRLAVNRLLEGADPILGALHDRRIGASEASRRMGLLERRFAAYAVDVAAIDPATAQLHALNAGYADTYVFEDAYLSALVVDLRKGDLDDLPNTQAAQRAAIIRWRIALTVLARAAHAPLPADLQQAGRGEIAPSPTGS